MNLLVIDDEEAVGTLIAQVIAKDSWKSIYRSSSQGISDLIRHEKIDILLIDYFMSERLGIDVVESLRKEGFKLPVILFSGNTKAIDRARVAELDIMSVVQKPLSLAQLRATLDEAKKLVLQQKTKHL